MLTIGSHIAAGRLALQADLPRKKKGCKCGCSGDCKNKKAIAHMIEASRVMFAYGTSEGATHGWDTRGRGQKSVREATKKFPVWKSLQKAGFKEISQRRKDVRTFTTTAKTPPSKFDEHVSNYKHRIDVKSDGSWRHSKGPLNSDFVTGRVHGTNLDKLDQHLKSGKYQTSFRNEGWGSNKWNDVPESR